MKLSLDGIRWWRPYSMSWIKRKILLKLLRDLSDFYAGSDIPGASQVVDCCLVILEVEAEVYAFKRCGDERV